MTDLFKWTVLQTEINIYGNCHDFVTVTNIRDFDISNCAIPVDGQWSSWTTTSCSMTCGNGMTYRNRTCDNPSPSDGGNMCQGVDNESTVCNLGDCPVDGHWGLWSSVRCSVTCGNGIGIRTRRCDNPAPSGGGNGCVGCDKKKKTMFLGKMSQWRMEESKKIKKEISSQTNEEYHELKKTGGTMNYVYHLWL
ncbi:Hypothetical predicted protein [Mytilus galloprovincialis]|uniref:Uncharacterized protein n=1 Tax=Mytilus galloprovincialis TaxID=29158 RepID=A0A8B6BTG0_MYTGA|nr:Hypothetical predicted protein [Mytilus galloprovincialis]